DAPEKFRYHAATKSFLIERSSDEFGVVSLCQIDPTREPGVGRLGEPGHAWLERVRPAKAFDRTGVARVDPLRLVAREQDELWFEAQFPDSIEERFRVPPVSQESLQSFGGNYDCFRRRFSNCTD